MHPVVTLFLDLDGVLHPLGTASWADGTFSAPQAFCWWPALREVLATCGAPVEIVVHSTWRLLFESDDELQQHLPVDFRAYFKTCTPRDVMARQASIEAYCQRNAVTRFVVLDDEPAAFSPGWPALLACDARVGVHTPGVLLRLAQALTMST